MAAIQNPGPPSLAGARDDRESAPKSIAGDSAAVAKELKWAEAEAERLKTRFEQYFIGVERMPPLKARDDWRRRVTRLRTSGVPNTGLRFRITQLTHKMNSYERYWNRTLKDIEEGRDRRQLFRLRMRNRGRRGGMNGEQPGLNGTAPPPEAAAEPAASKPRSKDISDDQLRKVYDAYEMARRKVGTDGQNLPFDRFAESLRRQIPKIIEQHQCRTVGFKISVSDGRAVLKVVPKR